jgi:hypothetical protein
MEEEIWKQVSDPRFDYVEVSNFGRVRRLADGFVYKICYNERGYHWINLRNKLDKTRGNYLKIHRLVAIEFIPNPRDPKIYNQVNHKDGVKDNNHVSNLEWMSCKENIQHAWATGIRKRKSEMNKTQG